jgi:steroid delta-isomerase-like uncharacterized protein
MRKLFFLFITLTLLFISCEFQEKKQDVIASREAVMKNTLDTLMYICWNKRDLNKLNEITSENISRSVNNIIRANDRKEVKANMNVIMTAFPDLFVKINNLQFSGNTAYIHWNMAGTNTGIYGEFPATGKKINVSGVSKIQFSVEGMINSEDVFYNELELLQQLGYTLNPPIVE